VHAWQRAEGGRATFNPFNTTLPLASATNYNRAKVKNYPDALAGTAATILTLRLAYYKPLIAALRANGLTAEQITDRGAKGLDTWGSRAEHVRAALTGSNV
jgi:hypothetical protein